MPELPDITVYIEALDARVRGARLLSVRLGSPFVLRSVDPPLAAAFGKTVTGLRRVGKRIVIALEDDLFLVLHLMIAGRLHWKEAGARLPGKVGLAAFDFSTGTLTLTEAGTKRRAAIHLVRGEAALREHDPGGLEVFDADLAQFGAALRQESHTLKRALTDPRLFSGIGNAYSDEILHRARLSPVKQTLQLNEVEVIRLFEAARATLTDWIKRLRRGSGGRIPRRRHRLSPEDGGAWPLRQALPRLRRAGAAHRLRRQRDELLPALPDGRPSAGRSRALAAAQAGLAAHRGGVGGAPARARARLRSCMLAAMSAGKISRRGFIAVLIGLIGTPAAAAGKPAVTVYKEPT